MDKKQTTIDYYFRKNQNSKCALIDKSKTNGFAKIISGGQTGADRAALEVACALNIETGGWAPKEFWTSEGRNPKLGTKYGLREIEVGMYFKNIYYVAKTIVFR